MQGHALPLDHRFASSSSNCASARACALPCSALGLKLGLDLGSLLLLCAILRYLAETRVCGREYLSVSKASACLRRDCEEVPIDSGGMGVHGEIFIPYWVFSAARIMADDGVAVSRGADANAGSAGATGGVDGRNGEMIHIPPDSPSENRLFSSLTSTFTSSNHPFTSSSVDTAAAAVPLTRSTVNLDYYRSSTVTSPQSLSSNQQPSPKMAPPAVNKTPLHPAGVQPNRGRTALEEELAETAHIDYTHVSIIANPSVAALYEDALVHETGTAITSSGALTAYSGAKTGRSPSDKRIVAEPSSESEVWWGPVNKKMSPEVSLQNFFFCYEFPLPLPLPRMSLLSLSLGEDRIWGKLPCPLI